MYTSQLTGNEIDNALILARNIGRGNGVVVARENGTVQFRKLDTILSSASTGVPESTAVWDAVNSRFSSYLVFRGTVPSRTDLPDGATVGDAYHINDTNKNFAWDGENWADVGAIGALNITPEQIGAARADEAVFSVNGAYPANGNVVLTESELGIFDANINDVGSVDTNSFYVTGVYKVSAIHNPDGTQFAGNCVLISIKSAGSYYRQIAYRIGTLGSTDSHIWTRQISDDGNAGNWLEFMLGADSGWKTVSQMASMPGGEGYKTTYGFTDYDGNGVRCRRIGNVVHMEGAITNTKVVPTGNQIMFVLPELFRPGRIQQILQQSTSKNTYFMQILPSGVVYCGRFGTTGSGQIDVGGLLPVTATWFVD